MKLGRKILFGLITSIMMFTGVVGSSNALWKDYNPYGGFDSSWKRFYGVNRIKTAEYTANSINPHKNATDVYMLKEEEGVPTVLVNKDNFQDGLSAYNLVRSLNARLLLINPDYANIGLMRDYYKSKTIYLLGSEKEIYKSTENYIKKYMPKAKVVRIGDSDAYSRNLKTIRIAGFKDVAVADGRNFPDALSASGLCHNKNLGLMLVKGNEDYNVPSDLNVSYTVGGEDSVKIGLGKRLYGRNRYETAKEVARETKNYYNILFADGKKFPDSISAINLVKPRNSIVLLISDDRDNSDMKEFLSILPAKSNAGWDIERTGYAIVIGGHSSISDKTVLDMLYPSRFYN